MKYSREDGQALVIVLLSLSVVLTLVLFILARSITDITISSRSEESVRAFSAAEAGIEKGLVIGGPNTETNVPIGNAKYTAVVAGYAFNQSKYNYPFPLYSGDTMNVWYISHLANGTLGCSPPNYPCFAGTTITVCWGAQGELRTDSNLPAIEVTTYYETTDGNLATVAVARAAVDPSNSRYTSDKFDSNLTSSPCTITDTAGSVTYAFGKQITLPTAPRLLFSSIRMLYNSTKPEYVGVDTGAATLPSQGPSIESTGYSGNSQRKVKVFQTWPDPPTIFDFAIYSGTGLVKNNP
jgi:hypothetical protein